MMIRRRTPLARKNLLHNRRRLLVAVLGIGFAVVLMFMQSGFKNALFESTVKIITDLDADILLASRAQYALPAKHPFPDRRIYQARACPGVAAVRPLYIETFYAIWKPVQPEGPGKRKGHPIRVLGVDLDAPVFRFPLLRDALSQPGTAVIDTKSKSQYHVPDTLSELRKQRGMELSGRSIRLVGTFQMGTDFANDGNLIMSAANFASYFPFRAPGKDPLSVVDLGLVKVRPGADVRLVRQQLNDLLPDDVAAYVKEEFIDKEIGFWAKSTPIGYIFRMGSVMGFIVGMVICYQVIYSGIAEYLSEFATLKAMGYRDRYFIGLVLATSLYLSVLSYVPGLLISFGLYVGLASSTGLLMNLDFWRAAQVFGLTLAMCVASGCLAMRKVLAADPAELF